MIEWKDGDILQADAEAIVNTVNTVGVMGKGIALQFKQAYPEMFAEYEKLSKANAIQTGHMHVFDRGVMLNPRYIINFPTKQHWRSPSKIEYVSAGLAALISEIQRLDIKSIAIPPLGCGSGGLDWTEVKPLIADALATVPQVRALVYAPQEAFAKAAFKKVVPRPEMTASRAKVLSVLKRYTELGYELTLIEAHKLLYFLQEAGEPLRLRYTKGTYGPYADNLRFVLQAFEGHFTKGFADSRNTPRAPLQLISEAVEEANQLIAQQQSDDGEAVARLKRVEALIEGFESPYGMELLASVHWVIHHEAVAAGDLGRVTEAVQGWNERKRKVMQPAHIEQAWQRLSSQAWV